MREDVVEVDHPSTALLGLVGGELRGDGVESARRPPPSGPCRGDVVLCGDASRPGPLEFGEHAVDAAGGSQHVAEQPSPVGEDRQRWPIGVDSALLEDAEHHRVEGSGLDTFAKTEPAEAPPEFARRLAREGQGEGVLRVGGARRDAVRDPPRQHPGLTRPGAGDDRDEQRRNHDRGALVGVEVRDQRIRIHMPTIRSGAYIVCAMPYPRDLLNDDETIAVDLHPHWWFFALPAALLFAGVVLAILSLAWDSDWLKPIAIVVLLVAAVWLGTRYLKWKTTNFVVTSDRVIFRAGVIGKHAIEIPLERVNTVFSKQGMFERMVGTGDLLIESGGERGEQRFTDVYDPNRVQNVIHQQMDVNEERRGARSARGGAGTDVAGQLEKFEGMLERGTITQEEFDTQKRRLLGT